MIGKVGCGKTTLSQRLKGQKVCYKKTQTIEILGNDIVDTPGEYLERKSFYNALIVTAAEADIVLLLLAADDEQNAFSPRMNSLFYGKPLIGVITKIDLCNDFEKIEQCHAILEMAGALEIYSVGLNDDESVETLKKAIENLELHT